MIKKRVNHSFTKMLPYFRNILTQIKNIPQAIKVFLIKALVLLVLWKILYVTVLIPKQFPDTYLVKSLGSGTAWILNQFYSDHFVSLPTTRWKAYGNDGVWATYTYVVHESGRKVLGIYQACNGLELMVLYTGFILCFPSARTRKTLFVFGGIIGIYIINLLRCAGLGWIVLEHPQHFMFAHKYFFNIIVYGFIFMMWVFFVNQLSVQKNASKVRVL